MKIHISRDKLKAAALFAVVMPMRGDKADVADVAWAREAVPA